MLITVITFLGVLTMIIGAYWALVVVPENRDQSALRLRLKPEPLRKARVGLLKAPDVLSDIVVLNKLLSRLGALSGPLKELIDQGGLPLTVGTFVLLSIACFLGGMLAVRVYVPLWWLAPI